jgi:hypothetical protein
MIKDRIVSPMGQGLNPPIKKWGAGGSPRFTIVKRVKRGKFQADITLIDSG